MIIDYKRLAIIAILATLAALFAAYAPPEAKPVGIALSTLAVGALRSFLRGEDEGPPSGPPGSPSTTPTIPPAEPKLPPILPVLMVCLVAALAVGCSPKLDANDGATINAYASHLAECRKQGLDVASDAGAEAGYAAYQECAK